MIMFRIKSQTKEGYPDSHGYYHSRNNAELVVNALREVYANRNTKFWIIEVH